MKRYFLLFVFLIQTLEKSDVYFTKEISGEKIVEMFKKLNVKLEGNIGLKVHTGEKNGPYFLRPAFLKNIYDYTNGTFIECNTAYEGSRHLTKLHKQLLEWNGWSKYRTVILDEEDNTDISLKVEKPSNISLNFVGKHIKDYNSCLVLAHFKGHTMGGFGGAMKQLSIGFASRQGKCHIHSGGFSKNYKECWKHKAKQEDFTAAMADAASTVTKYFKDRGGIAYINVLANISTMCDCGGSHAPEPKIRDIGILASTDPIAIDKACYDLILRENNNGSQEWNKQAEKLMALNTLKIGETKGMGSLDYNLIDVDDDKNDIWYVYYIIIPVAALIVIGIIIGVIIYIKKRSKIEEDDKNSLGLLGENDISKDD